MEKVISKGTLGGILQDSSTNTPHTLCIVIVLDSIRFIIVPVGNMAGFESVKGLFDNAPPRARSMARKQCANTM